MSDDNHTEKHLHVEHDNNMGKKRLVLKEKQNLNNKTIKWLHLLYFNVKVVAFHPSYIPKFEFIISKFYEKYAPIGLVPDF